MVKKRIALFCFWKKVRNFALTPQCTTVANIFNTIMPMIFHKPLKEEYIIPLAELCDVQPDILCQSPDEWGNESLSDGEPWN